MEGERVRERKGEREGEDGREKGGRGRERRRERKGEKGRKEKEGRERKSITEAE